MHQRDKDRFEKITQMRDNFVRGAAHDLKNPLTLVGGYAEMMSRMDIIRQDPNLKQMVEEIQQSGSDMLDLIGNMLDVLRFQSSIQVERESIDLNVIVENVVAAFQPLTSAKSISLTFETDYSSVFSTGEANAIKRVVENLVSNSIKYSPESGCVLVKTDVVDGKSVLIVHDEGYGIPEYDLPQLFDPFFRSDSTSDKAEGTGLGLSVTKEIVNQHGGHIKVDSREGEGSIFTVTLPSK